MEHLFTKNEARVLRGVDRYHGSFLYEIASAAGLTPADVFDAAESLDGSGYLALDRGKRFVAITVKGIAAKEGMSERPRGYPRSRVTGSYTITPEDVRTRYKEMSERDVSKAIDAELDKFK